jgi:hypothetical protein
MLAVVLAYDAFVRKPSGMNAPPASTVRGSQR